MSVLLYDEALLAKIKKWIKSTEVTITGPEETRRLFEYIADKTNDKPLQLPIIALRRKPSIQLKTTNKRPLTFDGMKIQTNTDTSQAGSLNAIPISLEYSLDIYTRYEAEALEYVRNFSFNLINFPRVEIQIPYNGLDEIHYSNISLENTVVNNSDIPERLIPGQFSRYTFNFSIDDAYLFSYRIEDTWSVETDLDVELQVKDKIEEK